MAVLGGHCLVEGFSRIIAPLPGRKGQLGHRPRCDPWGAPAISFQLTESAGFWLAILEILLQERPSLWSRTNPEQQERDHGNHVAAVADACGLGVRVLG